MSVLDRQSIPLFLLAPEEEDDGGLAFDALPLYHISQLQLVRKHLLELIRQVKVFEHQRAPV